MNITNLELSPLKCVSFSTCQLRWEIKYALNGFEANELRNERILAEQKIYEVVSGW